MTTVAYRDGVLATDSASTAGGIYSGSVRKMARSPDGSLVGVSGGTVACAELLRWVEGGMQGRPDVSGDVYGVLIGTDRTVHIIEDGGRPVAIEASFFACGSGREIALGAMAMGASAQRAVEIACMWDRCTVGPVVVETV